jgi:S-phase kinase-associated protein 1
MTKVKLMSSDGHTFEVDEEVACESHVMKNVIEDVGTDDPIPLPNVSSGVLAKVIDYCKYHVDSRKATKEEPTATAPEMKEWDAEEEPTSTTPEKATMEEWDAEFIKVEQQMLFDLIRAANYLHIQSLLAFTCQTVANKIKGKSPASIMALFNIKNDRTPKEENQLCRENEWALEPVWV